MERIRPIVLIGILCTLSIAYGFLGTIEITPRVVSQKEVPNALSTLPLARVRVLPISHAQPISLSKENVAIAAQPLLIEQPILQAHAANEVTLKKTDEHAKVNDGADLEHTATLLAIVDQDDIHPEDKILLDKVLRWMPSLCRNNVEQLVVRYDPRAERGLSSASTILLRGGMNTQETIAVLIHECGHIIDLSGLNGTYDAGESIYPDGPVPTFTNDPSVEFYAVSWKNSREHRSNIQDNDFVSGYAKEDPFEDLAESITYYALQKRAFIERAQTNGAIAQKLAWVQKYVFPNDTQLPESNGWNGKVEWDTTKMKHGLEL